MTMSWRCLWRGNGSGSMLLRLLSEFQTSSNFYIKMSDEQKKLQDLSDEFQSLQTQLTTNIQARQKLESQEQENKSVQQEFSRLQDDANVYKLVGPVLLKQDKTEAVMAVDSRLQFIEKEIQRVEKQITEVQDKSEKKKLDIYQLQTELQQTQQALTAS